MEVYFGVAEEMDISSEELAAIRAMVMAVSAGRVFFQSKNVVEKMQTAHPDEGGAGGCSPGCCE